MAPAPLLLTDVVQQVVKKLEKQQQMTIPEAIVNQACEMYRVLATRTKVGSLPGDSAEKRAAALLELCSRKVTGKRWLTWTQLGQAVNAKKTRSLEQLQQKLSNYITTAAYVNKPTNQQQPKQQPHQQQQQTKTQRCLRTKNYKVNYAVAGNYASSNSATAFGAIKYTPKILATLVIRIAGHLVDPNGTMKRTTLLLQQLHEYDCEGITWRRREHLHDLQRYAPAYEAAALYHVVKDGRQQTEFVAEPSRRRGPKKKKSSKKDQLLHPDDELEQGGEDNDDGNDNDDNDQQQQTNSMAATSTRPLSIADLMDASTEFTYLEFKQVLPRVQELAKTIQEKSNMSTMNNNKNKNTLEAAASGNTNKRRPPWQRQQQQEEDSRKRQASGAVQAILGMDRAAAFAATTTATEASGLGATDKATSNDDDDDLIMLTANNEPTFAEWKEEILAATRARHLQLDQRAAMAVAAGDVLLKYGLD